MNPMIDPLTTSFRQLKTMVDRTDGQKLPSASALRDSGSEILFSHEHCDVTITVFRNGFYLYECLGRETVFAVDRITAIVYEYQDNEVKKIPERDFANGPCLIPLLALADGRIAHNLDNYEWYWHEFSLSEDEEQWSQGPLVNSAEDIVLHEEDIQHMQEKLTCITERQRQIIRLYYGERLNEKQISEILHITQPSVARTLKAAKKRLKRFF